MSYAVLAHPLWGIGSTHVQGENLEKKILRIAKNVHQSCTIRVQLTTECKVNKAIILYQEKISCLYSFQYAGSMQIALYYDNNVSQSVALFSLIYLRQNGLACGVRQHILPLGTLVSPLGIELSIFMPCWHQITLVYVYSPRGLFRLLFFAPPYSLGDENLHLLPFNADAEIIFTLIFVSPTCAIETQHSYENCFTAHTPILSLTYQG